MLNNHFLDSPFSSRRSVSIAKNGMVATSQPLAAQIGLDILKVGGNAIDAAIATAAALTVVEPTGCGLGGDAFAIVWFKGKMHGLNASGPAPKMLTPELVMAGGNQEMPLYGWTPVTVPGCPASWAALSERFGELPFRALLEPAIDLARNGFPVSPVIGYLWQTACENFNVVLDRQLKHIWFDTFAPYGIAPSAGSVFRSEGHARTLESLAESRCESFYRGELASAIDRYAKETGGYLRREDLARYRPEWTAPISARYRGYDIWEMPPNGQGLVALMALKILNGLELSERETVDSYHKMIESLKLAYSDGFEHIAQPDTMKVSVESLLGEDYIGARRQLIGQHALAPKPGRPKKGGTVYLATADRHGNMVSFIQSNYHGFGSGVVIPDTGIAMQNRGHNFSLDPGHVNFLQPGKKSLHTIIPGFITKDQIAIGPFGVMGGFMQPQGHVQIVANMADFGLNPQAALDAPRWQWLGDKKVGLEATVPEFISSGLMKMGHQVEIDADRFSYGRGQIILRNPLTGVYIGGTESRTDGHIACW